MSYLRISNLYVITRYAYKHTHRLFEVHLLIHVLVPLLKELIYGAQALWGDLSHKLRDLPIAEQPRLDNSHLCGGALEAPLIIEVESLANQSFIGLLLGPVYNLNELGVFDHAPLVHLDCAFAEQGVNILS